MPESQGTTVTSVAVTFAVISLFAILARIWARAFLVKSFGADDYLICVAVLLSWAFVGCTIASVQYGLGSHIEDVMLRGTENMITYSQIVWLSSIFYNACLGFIKLSVLALYQRLGDSKLAKLSIIMMGVIACQAGGNVLACIFQCSPVHAAYDVTILPENKTCININAFYLANAAVNIATDVLTYTLPIPLVIKLQVSRRTKIGLAVILCLGLFACISSVVRITYVPPMLTSDDPTWVISGAMYWSVIETNIGILAASIPSFKSIAMRYAPGLLRSSKGTSGKRSGFKMMPVGTDNDRAMSKDAEDRMSKAGVETRIERTVGANSSEEELFSGNGQIRVKTEFVHHSEDTSQMAGGRMPQHQGRFNTGHGHV